MQISRRLVAGAALLVPLVLLPKIYVLAQPTIQVARPTDVEDCNKLRQELEQLQQELNDTNAEIQRLQLKINSLNDRISEVRQHLNDPFWGGEWIPGYGKSLQGGLLNALELAVRQRSQLIKELREYQQRLIELRKQITDLLSKLNCTPATTTSPPQTQSPQQVGEARPPMRLAPANQRILDLHNGERVAFGAPLLQWDPALAQAATAHAAEMARTGKLTHASRQARGIARENINQVFHGSSPDQLMANWLSEKRNFAPGTFPNVSSTGNWADVGHYSQMIWPATTHVGCGSARGARWDYFVCRYSPGGNRDGVAVGTTPVSISPRLVGAPALPGSSASTDDETGDEPLEMNTSEADAKKAKDAEEEAEEFKDAARDHREEVRDAIESTLDAESSKDPPPP